MMEEAQAAEAPIFWEDLSIGGANSAGGKEISWVWHNTSENTVKYATFRFAYYNAVGDYTSCEYGAGTKARQTGPIEPGSRESRKFSSLCYDSDVVCGEIQSAELEFMNGETVQLDKEELMEMDAIDESDKCGEEY